LISLSSPTLTHVIRILLYEIFTAIKSYQEFN
jgi:hypothetical protein